jgi:propanediol dehydratase large subunit
LHGINGVTHQVGDNLAELAIMAENGNIGSQVADHRNLHLPKTGIKQSYDRFNQFIQIDPAGPG